MKNLKVKIIVLLAFLLCLTCNHTNKDEATSKKNFEVTIESVENGEIVAKQGETVLTSEALRAVEENSLVTFTLKANGKYKVKHLTIDGKKYENVENNTISANVKVKKNFSVQGEVIAFFIITIKNAEHGNVNVLKDNKTLDDEDLKEVIKDTQVTFRLISDDGYKPKFLKVGDEIINNDEDKLVLEKQVAITKDIEVSFEVVENPLRTYTIEKEGKQIIFKMLNIPLADNVTLGGDYNDGHKDVDNKMNKKHTASVSSFYLCSTETTQELYQAMMGENPSKFQGSANIPAIDELQEKRPVEKVTWFEAVAFCNVLTTELLSNADCVYYSDKEKTQIYTKEDAQFKNGAKLEPKPVFADWSKKGFRLPTDTEWEWAARGGEGHKYAGSDELDSVSWHKDNSNSRTHEVAKKSPNGYGLYDMTGNVAEWCWDWMVAYTENSTLEKDYKGVETGTKRVTRPSSYFYASTYQILLFRGNGLAPDKPLPNTGFRIAQNSVN